MKVWKKNLLTHKLWEEGTGFEMVLIGRLKYSVVLFMVSRFLLDCPLQFNRPLRPSSGLKFALTMNPPPISQELILCQPGLSFGPIRPKGFSLDATMALLRFSDPVIVSEIRSRILLSTANSVTFTFQQKFCARK